MRSAILRGRLAMTTFLSMASGRGNDEHGSSNSIGWPLLTRIGPHGAANIRLDRSKISPPSMMRRGVAAALTVWPTFTKAAASAWAGVERADDRRTNGVAIGHVFLAPPLPKDSLACSRPVTCWVTVRRARLGAGACSSGVGWTNCVAGAAVLVSRQADGGSSLISISVGRTSRQVDQCLDLAGVHGRSPPDRKGRGKESVSGDLGTDGLSAPPQGPQAVARRDGQGLLPARACSGGKTADHADSQVVAVVPERLAACG